MQSSFKRIESECPTDIVRWSFYTAPRLCIILNLPARFSYPLCAPLLQVVWTWLRDSLSRAAQALPALWDHSPRLHRMLVWYPHLLQGLHTWQQSWTFLNILQDYGPGCRDAVEDLPPHPRPHHGHPCRGSDDCHHALWQEVIWSFLLMRFINVWINFICHGWFSYGWWGKIIAIRIQ